MSMPFLTENCQDRRSGPVFPIQGLLFFRVAHNSDLRVQRCLDNNQNAFPLERAQDRRNFQNYLTWDVAVNYGSIVLQASEIEEAHNISFEEAMIVSAAHMKNAAILLTEDLNVRQQVEGMTIVNPFLK
jgi:hypothetical protein